MSTLQNIGFRVVAAEAAALATAHWYGVDLELRFQMTQVFFRSICTVMGLPDRNLRLFTLHCAVSALPFLPLLFSDKEWGLYDPLACAIPFVFKHFVETVVKKLAAREQRAARPFEREQILVMTDRGLVDAPPYQQLRHYHGEFREMIEGLEAAAPDEREADCYFGATQLQQERRDFDRRLGLVSFREGNVRRATGMSKECVQLLNEHLIFAHGEGAGLSIQYMNPDLEMLIPVQLIQTLSSFIEAKRLREPSNANAAMAGNYSELAKVTQQFELCAWAIWLADKVKSPSQGKRDSIEAERTPRLLSLFNDAILSSDRGFSIAKAAELTPFLALRDTHHPDYDPEKVTKDLIDISNDAQLKIRQLADAFERERDPDVKEMMESFATMAEAYFDIPGTSTHAGAGAGAGTAGGPMPKKAERIGAQDGEGRIPLAQLREEFMTLQRKVAGLSTPSTESEVDSTRSGSSERPMIDKGLFSQFLKNIHQSLESIDALYTESPKPFTSENQNEFLLELQKIVYLFQLMESNDIEGRQQSKEALFITKYNLGGAVLNVLKYLCGSLMVKQIGQTNPSPKSLPEAIQSTIQLYALFSRGLSINQQNPFMKYQKTIQGQFDRQELQRELIGVADHARQEVRRLADSFGSGEDDDFKKIILKLQVLVEKDYELDMRIGAPTVSSRAGAGAAGEPRPKND